MSATNPERWSAVPVGGWQDTRDTLRLSAILATGGKAAVLDVTRAGDGFHAGLCRVLPAGVGP